MIKFNELEIAIQPYILSLLQKWLPNGDFIGNDYCPLNPTRADKHKGSFRINCKTGQWHDFATNDKGVNLISLYAYINGIKNSESAEILSKELNINKGKNMTNILKYENNIDYQLVSLPRNYEYKCFVNARGSWAYRDVSGSILIVTDRFDCSDGSKKVLPRCYVKNMQSNKEGWVQRKLLHYNPLYNMENFQEQQNLPILFVEGEKTCEAAKNIYGKDFWCTTWLGGANGTKKVDVSAIKGRSVYLLPDNDKSGRDAMTNMLYMLKANNNVHFVDYPENEFPPAWDIADEFPPNWTHDTLKNFIFNTKITKEIKEPIKMTQENKEKIVQTLTKDTEPYPESVNGLELVNSLIDIIKKYIVVTDGEAIAMAYWILQTYNVNEFTYAPRLLIISPDKRCGKSTLLRLLELLSYKSYPTGNCSAAVLYKIIEKEQPTILIDEADSFFNGNNDIRNIINSGFQKKFGVARSCGKNFEDIKTYNVFAMMAIASIKNLPDTIMDRSIKINMRRRLPTEKIESLREQYVKEEFETIKRKCRRFMSDNGKQAGEYIMEPVNGLSDRACDVWEGLVGIASIFCDEQRVIKTAEEISLTNAADVESLNNLLLKHILQIFVNNHFFDISSAELVNKLCEIEDSPWRELNQGRPITAHKLSFLLKEYKISTFQKNFDGHNTKHYNFDAFTDIFNRYIPKEYKQAMLKKAGSLDDMF